MKKTNLNAVGRSYKRLAQDSLIIFASQVFDRMTANPHYKDLAADVEKLGILVSRFHHLVKAAQSGDRSIIAEKNQQREDLLTQLERIGRLLEHGYDGQDKWIVESGMELLPPRIYRKRTQNLAAPFNIVVENQKSQNGELLIKFQTLNGPLAVTNAVEYSYDNGQTWNDGTYGNSRGIWLRDLVPDTLVLVRVRAVGRRQKMSAWSEAVKALVL